MAWPLDNIETWGSLCHLLDKYTERSRGVKLAECVSKRLVTIPYPSRIFHFPSINLKSCQIRFISPQMYKHKYKATLGYTINVTVCRHFDWAVLNNLLLNLSCRQPFWQWTRYCHACALWILEISHLWLKMLGQTNQNVELL